MVLDESRTSAMALWTGAKSFHSAAIFLHAGITEGTLSVPYSSPVHLMIGHTFELALKAKLRATGEDLPALVRRGHDLERLLEAAESKGLAVDISSTERDHLALLNSLHGRLPYASRYAVTGSRTEPDTQLLAGFAGRILVEIKSECLAASS